MEDEKKFLHDIANPLNTVFLVVDALIETKGEKEAADSFELKQLTRAREALKKVQEMIQARRSLAK